MADRSRLLGKRVAILVDDGFEEVELVEPRKALEGAGAETVVVSPRDDVVKGWQHDHWGDQIDVDLPLEKAHSEDFDALFLPGGVMNPDHLRMNQSAVDFVKDFFVQEKPVAAICHGPWMLVEADAVRGRSVTSWPSLKTDLRNAGAKWTDHTVVVDGNIVTSRNPDDIPAFSAAIIEEFGDYIPPDGPREAVQSRAFNESRP